MKVMNSQPGKETSQTYALLQSVPTGSTLRLKAMGILALLISTGFVWMAVDQMILLHLQRHGISSGDRSFAGVSFTSMFYRSRCCHVQFAYSSHTRSAGDFVSHRIHVSAE
jgi:hypothetical protein